MPRADERRGRTGPAVAHWQKVDFDIRVGMGNCRADYPGRFDGCQGSFVLLGRDEDPHQP
jgi:hypothetical protein